MRTRRIALLTLWMAAVPARAAPPWRSAVDHDRFAAPPADIDADPKLRVGPRTPHGFQLRPYCNGPTEALVFVLAMETKPREIAELVQRFDLNVDLVYVTQGYKYTGKGDYYENIAYYMQIYQKHKDFAKSAGAGPGEERLNRLLEQDHDVYVFADVLAGNWPPGTRHKFDFLTPRQTEKIAAKVRGGAGIVCTGELPAHFFLAAERPMPQVPSSLTAGCVIAHLADHGGILAQMRKRQAPVTDRSVAEALITAYGIGKGRGIHIAYPNVGQTNALVPLIPHGDVAEVEYDHWMAWVGKAVLWAAGKESGVDLTFPAERSIFRQDGGPSNAIRVDLVGHSGEVNVQPRVVNRYGEAWELPAVTLKASQRSASIALPQLPVGDYFLDVTCATNRGVLGFWSKAFAIDNDVWIQDVILKDLSALPGEVLRGRVRLHNVFAWPGRELCVYLRDSFGRDIGRTCVALPESRAAALFYGHGWQRRIWYEYPHGKAGQYEALPFERQVPENATLSMRAVAVLRQDGRVIDRKRAHFTSPQLDRTKFRFFQWDPPCDYLGYHAFRRLAENGWNAVLTQEGRSSGAALACNMPAVRYVARVTDRVLASGVMDGQWLTSRRDVPIPWNDDATMDAHFARLARAYGSTAREGVLAYSLGDEGTLRGADLSPQDLRAYRQYLREQYGGINALNDSWATRYEGFQDVGLVTFDAVIERYGAVDAFNEAHNGSFETWEKVRDSYAGAYGPTYKIKAHIYGDWAFLAGNYPRWYDRQAFARRNFGELLGRFARAIRQCDPRAVVGVEGVRSIWGHRINLATFDGIWRNPTAVADHDDLAAITGFLGMDGNNPVSDVLRALASPGDIHIAQRWMQ